MQKVNLEKVKTTPNSDRIKTELFIIVFFLLLSPFFTYSQKWEVGGAIGGGNYMGDVSPTFRFENYRPGGGLFVRYNFSKIVSVKIGANGIQAKGSDKYYKDPVLESRGLNFIRFVGELGAQFEYNFFDYRDEKSRRNWTPYFFTGVGGMYMFGREGGITPVIPAGIGARYILGGKWNLGLELGARKTFTDKFDRLSYIPPDGAKFNNGNPFDKDWYFLTTISISYTFYTIPCPFTFE